MVLPLGDDTPGREIAMPKPSRIFLGSRMAPGYKEKVISLARAHQIPVAEMVPSTGPEFGVQAVPLT